MNSELLNAMLEKKYNWNLSRFKEFESKCKYHSLSPNKRWLILQFGMHQEAEDRYDSEIYDEEFILFDLDNSSPENEIGRFKYYYNYNSCADWEEEIGSRFKWGEGSAILILEKKTINLETINIKELKNILEKI